MASVFRGQHRKGKRRRESSVSVHQSNADDKPDEIATMIRERLSEALGEMDALAELLEPNK